MRLTWVKKTKIQATDGTRFDAYLCDCGNGYFGLKRDVDKGKTKSCGCYRTERLRETGLGRTPANKLPDSERAARYTYYAYWSSAQARGFAFDIDLADTEKLIFADCFYCNAAPSREVQPAKSSGPIQRRVNGIDRLDSAFGYSASNCVTACADCNYLKSDRHVLDFLKSVLVISGKWSGCAA